MLVTTDKGLCGRSTPTSSSSSPKIKTPAKFVRHRPQGRAIRRPHEARHGRRFHRDDRVPLSPRSKPHRVSWSKQFLEGNVDTVEVIYRVSRTRSSRSRKSVPLLPLHRASPGLHRRIASKPTPGTVRNQTNPMTATCSSSPSASRCSRRCCRSTSTDYIYQLVLSAKASEHSARMVAMKTAKDNATKLVKRTHARIQQGPPGRDHPGNPRNRRLRVRRLNNVPIPNPAMG